MGVRGGMLNGCISHSLEHTCTLTHTHTRYIDIYTHPHTIPLRWHVWCEGAEGKVSQRCYSPFGFFLKHTHSISNHPSVCSHLRRCSNHLWGMHQSLDVEPNRRAGCKTLFLFKKNEIRVSAKCKSEPCNLQTREEKLDLSQGSKIFSAENVSSHAHTHTHTQTHSMTHTIHIRFLWRNHSAVDECVKLNNRKGQGVMNVHTLWRRWRSFPSCQWAPVGVNKPSHTHINTYMSAHRLGTHTIDTADAMLALAGPSRRKNCDGITQGNNRRALPWNSCPSLGDRSSEAWVEVWRVWGEEAGNLEGRVLPAEGSF